MTKQRECDSNLRASWNSPLDKMGDTLGLHPAPLTAPRHARAFTATCAPGLATLLLTSCSSIPYALTTFILPTAPWQASALWDADKRQDYFTQHNCPGYACRAICFDNLGRFSPGAMQLRCEANLTALPEPGHQRAVCLAIVYRRLSVVQCRYPSQLLIITTAASLHTARTGAFWIRGPPLPSPAVLHCACGYSCKLFLCRTASWIW
jgi:hypothetical protein